MRSQTYNIGKSPRGYCIIIDNTKNFEAKENNDEETSSDKNVLDECTEHEDPHESNKGENLHKSNNGEEPQENDNDDDSHDDDDSRDSDNNGDPCKSNDDEDPDESNSNVALLKHKFGEVLGLHVQTFLGLSRRGIYRVLEIVSSISHCSNCCLVVVILSKGKHCAVYDVQGKRVPITKIFKYFTRSLAGLPKLFLFHTETTKSRPKVIDKRCKARKAQPSDLAVVFTTEPHSNLRKIWQPLLLPPVQELHVGSESTTIVADPSSIRYFHNKLTRDIRLYPVNISQIPSE